MADVEEGIGKVNFWQDRSAMVSNNHAIPHTGSRIFEGYRSVGNVSSEVPALTRFIHRRGEHFIVTAAGKTFNTYVSQQLKHVSVSGALEDDISCMAVDTYHVYTGSKEKIYAWRRGTELKHVFSCPGNVLDILPFGEDVYYIDDKATCESYNLKSGENNYRMYFHGAFKPKFLFHPATYVNKILIVSEKGQLELWNVSGTMVFHFEGWATPITKVEQSPALHTIGIALWDKRVILFNLNTISQVMELSCLDRPVSLAFRTDGVETLLVGGAEGAITVWDLKDQAIVCRVENAHDQEVSGLKFFPNEPIFITSSSDNSLKVWIFDLPSSGFRLLNFRDGHSGSSNRIRFHGASGYNVLSAGLDGSFRMFHIYNETYNRCLSKTAKNPVNMYRDFLHFRAPVNKEVSPIIDFTTQTITNPPHHDDIAACHMRQVSLSTWSYANTKKGAENLILRKYENLPKVDIYAICICITSCSQFVICGYSNGTVEKFNIQSHLHRKSYGNPAHPEGAVRGVAVDHVNSLVVTGGSDVFLKFWDFNTGLLSSELVLSAGISKIFFHRLTSLIGVTLDDFSIAIVDMASLKIFRHFTEISSQVLDACFSPDNRWITASSSDCIIRTWDLPTSKMIDIFRLESIVTSMDYSPNGEFLATALHNKIGIYLWMNKTLFIHVSLMPIPGDYEPPILGLEQPQMPISTDEIENYNSPKQIEDLVTLSLLPVSQWKNLRNLDVIKMRNKPKQPPKTYVAPFFLSSLTAPNDTDISVIQNGNLDNSNITSSMSKVLKTEAKAELSNFAKKLLSTEKSLRDYEELCRLLEEMGPSSVDKEIESLGPLVGGSIDLLKNFIEFIDTVIKSNMSFEIIQAYLGVFIKKHGDVIQKNEELLQPLQDLQNNMTIRVSDLSQQVNAVISFTSFLKTTLF